LGGLVQQRLSPVFETDLKGRLRDANDLFLDELGIEREALIHFRLEDLAVRGDLLFAPEHLAQHAETIGHAPLECVFLGPRGTQCSYYADFNSRNGTGSVD
jgi:PAS domain-containing protein